MAVCVGVGVGVGVSVCVCVCGRMSTANEYFRGSMHTSSNKPLTHYTRGCCTRGAPPDGRSHPKGVTYLTLQSGTFKVLNCGLGWSILPNTVRDKPFRL